MFCLAQNLRAMHRMEVFASSVFDQHGPADLSQGNWQDDERFVAYLRASWEEQYADYLGADAAGHLIARLVRSGALFKHHEPTTLLASIDGRRVGIAALRPLGELSLVTLLEVVPAYRGRGIGSQLLRAMSSSTRGLVAHVSIHRPRLLDLYVQTGFAVLQRSVVDHHGHPLMFDVVARLDRSDRY